MILDQTYNQKKREIQISYINEHGGKSFYTENINRFKAYVYDEQGQFKDAFGKNVGERFTEKPNKFDLKNYLYTLPDDIKEKLNGRTLPKLYTFDIETDYVPGVFPAAETASFPITTISICSPELNTVVYGTKDINEVEAKWIDERFDEYLNSVEFYKELNLKIKPRFKYVKFDTEEDMIRSFFKDIVAKVPILAGWNSHAFDWQYFQNRVKNYYPNIPMYITSAMFTTQLKTVQDKYMNRIRLTVPTHTLILDMQEIIEGDKTVLPIKESTSLDWISEASLGVKKIEHDEELCELYNTDYAKYVFYNAIDSVLVQLIDRKFKTLQNYYLLALYCNMPIANSFSPIAMTEALFYRDFFNQGYKIVSEEKETPERGSLVGAYVKVPTPGKYRYPVCNDFASLYPSTIITCNISVENFVGKLNPDDVETINKYKADPDYFVTVNNSLYKNDREYSFKRIQRQLKEERKINKYLSKKLYAAVISDIDHILGNVDAEMHDYDQQMIDAIATINMENVSNITNGKELARFSREELETFRTLLMEDITFYTSNEQAIKLLMNSMYGGCSHISFYWYNMALANDITGEARNLTLLMEAHLSNLWTNYWYKSTKIHDMLGIKLKKEYVDAMTARDEKLKAEGGRYPTKQEEFDNAINNFRRSLQEAIEEKEKKKKK